MQSFRSGFGSLQSTHSLLFAMFPWSGDREGTFDVYKESITAFPCPFSLSHSFVYLLYFCPS